MNAIEIEEAVSELAARSFDAQEFPFAFLTAFGNKETTVKRLRGASSNSSDVPGGVLQQKNIHIATCAPGTVGATLKAVRESPKTASLKARFILATDGMMLEAEDLTTGETVACDYTDFPNHFSFFLALAGITTVKQLRENAFDIRATGRLNRLYLELRKTNPDWDKPERRHDMNHFMARLIFCFFAESTDIFLGEGLFTATIDQMSARDHAHIVAMTGSCFRGDAVPVLSPEDEARFETVTYTYYEQLNGYEHLKSLEIGYFFYTGPYLDAIMKVLDPALKTIVHIPSVNARESTAAHRTCRPTTPSCERARPNSRRGRRLGALRRARHEPVGARSRRDSRGHFR
jgi:hypothetical protein